MKITKSALREIILEEFRQIIKEQIKLSMDSFKQIEKAVGKDTLVKLGGRIDFAKKADPNNPNFDPGSGAPLTPDGEAMCAANVDCFEDNMKQYAKKKFSAATGQPMEPILKLYVAAAEKKGRKPNLGNSAGTPTAAKPAAEPKATKPVLNTAQKQAVKKQAEKIAQAVDAKMPNDTPEEQEKEAVAFFKKQGNSKVLKLMQLYKQEFGTSAFED